MEKNPLEEIRAEILRSQSSNYNDDYTRMGVSSEIIEISNALDVYFGIDRSTKTERERNYRGGDEVQEVLDRACRASVHSSLTARMMSQFNVENFSGVNQLIKKTKTPLTSIKEKLSKENILYLELSSMIVFIALKKVVSAINTYKRPESYMVSGYGLGIDINYQKLITNSVDVISALKDFDMTKECRDNYEKNRGTLMELLQTMNKTIMQSDKKTATQMGSSGCMIALITLFSSILSIVGVIVYLY